MENKKDMVEALDISKVIDVDKLVIKPNMVLISVESVSKSGLLLPAGVRAGVGTSHVIKKIGSGVKDYSIGDLVLDMNFSGANFYTKGDEKYIVCDVYNLILVTPKSNYNVE